MHTPISLTDAIQIARRVVAEQECRIGCPLRVNEKRIIEGTRGWMFYWNVAFPEQHIGIGGNAPFVVSKEDGSVHWAGLYPPSKQYLEEFDQTGAIDQTRPRPLPPPDEPPGF